VLPETKVILRRPGPKEYEVYLIGIDATLCEACGECSFICPTEVYELAEGVVVAAKPENCLGCMGCVGVCPVSAITITEI
jgi:NAD-dependent dihydropyrimidine dehydrogenase PreA subunit